MRIFVFPVSGGLFPLQLSYLTELCRLGINPDLVLGSSGGAIASYIGLASGWSADRLPDIVSKSGINCSHFASSWWPWGLRRILPSWLIGYYKGSLYASGSGTGELFTQMFTPESILQTEIWIGTLNRDLGRGQLFCNLPSTSSRIATVPDSGGYLWTRDCLPLTYLNGDLNRISKTVMASASIPIIVPDQEIDGQHYVDGGTISSSPLTSLADYLHSLNESQLHLDYINCCDIQAPSEAKISNLLNTGYSTFGEMMKNICVSDRLMGLDLIRAGFRPVHFATLDGTLQNLQLIESIRKYSTRSLLEFFPIKAPVPLDLINFTTADILKLLADGQKNYSLRFWWSTQPDIDLSSLHDQIPNLQTLPWDTHRKSQSTTPPSLTSQFLENY